MFAKPKAPPVISGINVIPMADIMLCLLIIFMVVVPLLGPGIAVELAQVRNPSEYPEMEHDAIFVTITRDGTVYLGQEKTTDAGASERVKSLLTSRANRLVFIKSDARARYGRVVAVVDEVRAAGVEQVALLTERVRDTKPRSR